MTQLIAEYVTDNNNSTFTVTQPNTGWVEYMNQMGFLYLSDSVPVQVHTTLVQTVVKNIQAEFPVWSKNLGIINQLANEKLNQDFVLPVFVDLDNACVTCGSSRMFANAISGGDLSALKTVFFTRHKRTDIANINVPIKQLTSTAEFEKIFDLGGVDYKISIAVDNNHPTVTRSVLSYGIYDIRDHLAPHAQITYNCQTFWEKFQNNQEQIEIHISCTAEVRELVQPSPWFKCHFLDQDPAEWGFAFGKIAGAYKGKAGRPIRELNLWLYDVTEPVQLELLIPWASIAYSCFYSKNKKSVLFETSHTTSMQIIGDWVK